MTTRTSTLRILRAVSASKPSRKVPAPSHDRPHRLRQEIETDMVEPLDGRAWVFGVTILASAGLWIGLGVFVVQRVLAG